MTPTINPTIKQNLSSSTTWFRLLFILLFALVFYALLWVVGLLILFQFLFTLFTGQPNANLHGFNRSVARYAEQIMEYFLFCSDKRPFPFSAWPSVEPRTAASASEKPVQQSTEEQASEPASTDTSPATESGTRG